MAERPDPSAPSSKTILIGLSGPSSSGKTTLARLLRQIFNVSVPASTNTEANTSDSARRSIKLFILHQDDFYKTDKDIPERFIPPLNTTLQDWDCIESIELPLLYKTLRYIKSHGSLPPDLLSKEDQNTVGESGVPDSTLLAYHAEIEKWLVSDVDVPVSTNANANVTICLLDGFLLYPDPSSPSDSPKAQMVSVMDEVLDTRWFIPSTRAQTITRRNARKGYVTLEGFWEDPEGYVEEVVWPNFGEDHGWLFGGDVNGEAKEEVMRRVDGGLVDREVAGRAGIEVGPGCGEVHLRELLPWAVERIKGAVIGKVGR